MMTKYNTEKAIIFNTYQVTYIVLHTTYMVVIILSRVNIDIGTMLCCSAVLPEGGLQDAAAGPGPGQQEQLLLQGEACTPRDRKRASQ